MKIERLHIDGFGTFHDKEIGGFKNGVNVLYGKNEAGKSTLLDFIRFTLFEYPRFLEERRPPINGGKHGGSIWLKNQANEPLSIYRHGNAKDVKFEYKNQVSENVNTYQRLIGNASIDLYKNVYAITLDELMKVQQLSDSGMEDRIFSMGMGLSGVDFGKFESDLKNHADELFTVRGRTQKLPELVNEIQNKEQVIRELRSKLSDYNRLSEKQDELEAELKQLKLEREQLGLSANHYADLERAYPSFVLYQEAKKQLTEIPNNKKHSFQLLEDFQSLKNNLSAEEKEFARIKNNIKQLEEKKKQLDWDNVLSEQSHLLDYFKTTVKLYEEAISKTAQEKEKYENTTTFADNILTRLGDNITAEQILALEGTFDLQSKAVSISEDLQKIYRQLESKKEVRKSIDSELEQLNARKSKTVEAIETGKIKNEKERISANEERIKLDTLFQQTIKSAGGIQPKTPKNALIISCVFLLVGVALFFVNVLAGATVSAIAVLSLLTVLLFTKKTIVTNDNSSDPTAIHLQMEEIKANITVFDEKYLKFKEIEQEISEKQKLQTSIVEGVEELKSTEAEITNKWKSLLESHNLPSSLEPQRISDFISNVEEYKRQQRDKKEAEKAIKRNNELIDTFEKKLKEVVPNNKVIDTPFIYNLIQKIEENQKIESQIERIEQETAGFEQESLQLKTGIKSIQSKIDDLFNLIKVKSEGEFIAYFEQLKHFEETTNKKETAENTIRTICGSDLLDKTLEELQEYTPAELKVKKEDTQNAYDQIKQKYDEMNRELATVSTEIRHILEPDEMYSILNEKESLESQLKEETKEWLATKVALKMLSESKQKYEAEKQPEVITLTRDYFKEITENAYEDLRISLSEKHVSLIDRQGKQKTVEELSRGTREQLLLALRMGLIAEYEKSAEPLPVALDDIMVNFDVHRSKNLAKTLTHFAKNRQVILFTCHEHTKELFLQHGANVIEW
ncbi:MAG: AAA family ATPase [Brumimicrobium sp.]